MVIQRKGVIPGNQGRYGRTLDRLGRFSISRSGFGLLEETLASEIPRGLLARCSLHKKRKLLWAIRSCRRHPTPLNEAFADIARCRRPCTACEPEPGSADGLPWTCSATHTPKGEHRQRNRYTMRGTCNCEPGNDVTDSDFGLFLPRHPPLSMCHKVSQRK